MNYNLRNKRKILSAGNTVEEDKSNSLSSVNSESSSSQLSFGSSKSLADTIDGLLEKKETEKQRRMRAQGDVRRVWRKTPDQVAYLERAFKNDPKWTTPTVKRCALHLQLGTSQIYKWGYDVKQQMKNSEEVASDSTSHDSEISMFALREVKKDLEKAEDFKTYIAQLVDEAESKLKTSTLNKVSSVIGILGATTRNPKLQKNSNKRKHDVGVSISERLVVSERGSESPSDLDIIADKSEYQLWENKTQSLGQKIYSCYNQEISLLDENPFKEQSEFVYNEQESDSLESLTPKSNIFIDAEPLSWFEVWKH